MINGEGTRETPSEIASPDPLDDYLPWQDQRFEGGGDDSPVLSRYSSCGESEFERYCSANSIMGTPSVCSSVGTFQECLDGELGSLKFRLGDYHSLENSRVCQSKKLSSSGRLDGNQKIEYCDGDSELGQGLIENRLNLPDQRGVGEWNDFDGSGLMRHSFGDKSSQGEAYVGVSGGSNFSSGVDVSDCLDGLNLPSDIGYDRRDGGGYSDEGGGSSRYEHSEGEDSMFGYGTDDEKRSNLNYGNYGQNPTEAKDKNIDSLLMTESTAFGLDDWEDFMQHTGENPFVPMATDELQGQREQSADLISATTSVLPSIGLPGQQKDIRDIPIASNQVEGAGKLASRSKSCSSEAEEEEEEEKVIDVLGTINRVGDANDSTERLDTCFKTNVIKAEQDPLTEDAHSEKAMNIRLEREREFLCTEKFTATEDDHVVESLEFENTEVQLDPVSNIKLAASRGASGDKMAEFLENPKAPSLHLLTENNSKRIMKDSPVSTDIFEGHPLPIKTENCELNGSYDEFVHDMEEVLLDFGESPGAMFTQQGNRPYQSQIRLPLRDGSSTASTSGTDDAFPLVQHALRIDRVKVLGARKMKGDVSLSERLVGVKEYTVYKIRVWSGESHWEVERRYRDFCTLYRRLKTLFADQGWILPSPWSTVERESRKIFGNASPDVIAERIVLIQECLDSVLHSRFSSGPPNALIWFLSPPETVPGSPASETGRPQSPYSAKGTDIGNVSTFGKTISLIVELWPYKSTAQMLEAQHYTCAGCHKHFDDGKTQMLELIQTLGWGKPRLCQYSGQLFCSSCHTNDAAVLPARVLHLWDFNQYPVSQLAKSFLDSTLDQPMLCVSAINPFLFAKVPPLQHVMSVRKRIGAMLPYIHCPFHRTIYKGLGSRRYLLESYDFFALRDLIDLSKGVFAALPMMVETVSRKILEHITEQCLVCCDVGVPCNARQACDDPSSLIFPFQEGEVERCRSCDSVFHKLCFKKIASCPCGAHLKVKEEVETTKGSPSAGLVGSEVGGTLDLSGQKAESGSRLGFLSELFSKAMPERLWRPRDGDTALIMGSLPSTSL
ncbi:hypothetical protein RJ640_005201 [Escallonia rubra]|uniref:PX domain-containing protein n=1 Tax=Escallonia rubra TaxID=112253 RepID=A0AA88R9Z1_9ASTE|nr:hypothetical protein RJ640_005201 [Escallonia rubra]